ncbi:hypothetical protein [Streptomyces sp. NPDC057280]|uniref:hypothetical protein n=1 Tax=Streptomyces sp. NPDC057280 TaxID=3346081 RepID=UPI0036411D2C
MPDHIPPSIRDPRPAGSSLDLAAAARDHGLLPLLGEANELYQQGLKELHRDIAARLVGLATAGLMTAAETTGMPCDASKDRAEVILLLARTEWEMTPAALKYTQMAETAARNGTCLIPEEQAGRRQGGNRGRIESQAGPLPTLLP